MADMTLNEIRELIIEFYTKNDPAKLRGGLDVAGMAEWTHQMGVDALNDVLFFQYGKKISTDTDIGTSKEQLNRISAVFGVQAGDDDGGDDFDIEEKEREQLKQRLEKFYGKHSEVAMSGEDLGRLVSFAMFHGVESLNEKLVGKYGEGIMDDTTKPLQSVKAQTMVRREPKIDNEKLYAQLKIFFEIHDPAWVDNLENVLEQARELGLKGLNARLIELYGESLDSVAEIAKRKKLRDEEEGVESSLTGQSNPLAEFSTKKTRKQGGKKRKKKKPSRVENAPLVNSLHNRLKEKFDDEDKLHHQNSVGTTSGETFDSEKEDPRFDNHDTSLRKRGPMGLPGFGPPPEGMFKTTPGGGATTEGATHETGLGGGGGGGGGNRESQYTEVSLSLPPPPFEEYEEEAFEKAPAIYEVDEAKLKQNLIKYYDKYDKEEIQNVDDVVELAKEIGEDELNVKLQQVYGEDLKEFVEREQANKTPAIPPKTPPRSPPKSPRKSFGAKVEEDDLDEAELKKQIILFYEKHDPERIGKMNDILSLSKQIGQKALNAYLKDLYGEDLDEVQRMRAKATELSKEVRGTKEKPKEPPRKEPPKQAAKPVARGMKEDLKIFYEKHDPLKLEDVDTIVNLGNKIGRTKLNEKLQQIYGQSLDETLAEHDGVPVEQITESTPVEPKKRRKKKRPQGAGATKAKKPPPGAVPLHPVSRVNRNPVKGKTRADKAKMRRNKAVSARAKLMSVKGGQIPKVPLVQFKKKDHGTEARNVLGTGNSATKVESGACDNYRLDMTGASFGVCKCGYPRADHVQKKVKRPEWAR